MGETKSERTRDNPRPETSAGPNVEFRPQQGGERGLFEVIVRPSRGSEVNLLRTAPIDFFHPPEKARD